MNEDKPFQPLRIPAAVIISAFTVIALTEIYGLDTESTSFDLPTTIVILIFWMISTGVATWNSPQAQGAASAVFTITALIGEMIPTSSEYDQGDLSRISPTLWVLSGIMCGSAVATCTAINRMSKHHSSLDIKGLILDKIAVVILVSILASAPLVSASYPRLWASSGDLGAAITAFFCGFAMTSLAGMAPSVSLIYLAITIGRYYTFDDADAARSYLVETLPLPLLAIPATAGLLTMYHDKRPRSTTSGKALKSSTSAQQKDAHES